jgi:hypothetical protein
MKLTIALIAVLSSLSWGQAHNWVLSYRDCTLKHKTFQSRPAAEDWIEHQAYSAVELRQAGVVYPCSTSYDYEQALIPGESELQFVRTKIVGCYSKAEMDDFKRRQEPSPAIGWTAN